MEFLGSYDPSAGDALSTPLFISATWTDASLESALSSGGGDNILAGGVVGAEIPYVPEWKLSFGAGLVAEAWGVNADATYVSDMFGTAENRDVPGSSSREGKVDGGFLVDLAGYVQLSDDRRLIGGVHNVLDETITVSRLPEGPRSNAPREVYFGFEFLW